MKIGWSLTKLQLLAFLDRSFLLGGTAILAILIFTASHANIVADSVDYYAILQWMTPGEEKPIVRNLHFAEQRSPGYSLTALVPYGLLALTVQPYVSTENVADVDSGPLPPPGVRRADTDRGPPGSSAAGRPGSEFQLIPSRPLLLRDVPFKDFYVQREGSWFQWKLVVALAVTSYSFLFLGMAASAWALRMGYPGLPGYSLIPLTIFSSVLFVRNIVDTPLYATLTAYGGSSLLVLYFVKGYASRRTRDLLIAGFLLGFVVLTRLETGVIAGTLALLLLARKEWRMVSELVLGASWAMVAWAAYNFGQFGTPLHLGILKGDINRLALDATSGSWDRGAPAQPVGAAADAGDLIPGATRSVPDTRAHNVSARWRRPHRDWWHRSHASFITSQHARASTLRYQPLRYCAGALHGAWATGKHRQGAGVVGIAP